MTTLTVAGHSVTVGDEFLKLSPEEQHSAVDEIAKHLPAEKPSGIAAGFAHGVSDLAAGDASTLGTAGIKSEGLDGIAANTADAGYKSAPIIREGGHWYNPSDYNLGNIPQTMAEQAPGLAQDVAAGKTGSMIGGRIAGPRGAAIGGGIGGLGSMFLRTFGPGAHENAAARTGDTTAEPNSSDLVREGVKQAVAAPLNVIGINRLIPGLTGRVAGVGASGTGEALKKYLTTVGTEAATGGARDAVNQIGTTLGTDKGVQFDPNRTAEAAIASGATSGALVAPRLAGDVSTAVKFRQFGGDNAEASTALANRQLAASASKKLVGPEAVDAAHADVHNELSAAAKNETGLSQDNANTLKRVQSGGTANNAELKNLATEASPDTMSLARQALLSSKIKDMGVGGISGAMDQLGPIARPATYIGGAALGTGIPGIGHLAIPALASVYGAYGVARGVDAMTGARNPGTGFTEKFADPNAPIRTPAPAPAPQEPATTSVPQVAPPQDTALWGNPADTQPSLRATLNTNAKLEEGMARMVKQVAANREQPAATPAPAPPPQPNLSPVAMMMLKQKLKQGLPAEAPPEAQTAPVEATPTDAFDALKPLMGRQRAVMRGLTASSKQQVSDNVAQRKAAGIAQAEGLASDSHAINEQGGLSALSNPEFTKRGSQLLSAANTMRKLTAVPEEAPAVSDAPASPAISALMQKLQATSQPPAAQAAPGAPTAPQPAPAAPVSSMSDILSRLNPTAPAATPAPPVIATIKKKSGKPVEATPAPEAEQPYNPIPEAALWRKAMRPPEGQTQDQAVAEKELASYAPVVRNKYSKNIVDNRESKRDIVESISNDHPEDAPVLAALYHQIDHISRRLEASKAIRHYTAHMSPQAAHAVNSRFTKAAMEKMWKTE